MRRRKVVEAAIEANRQAIGNLEKKSLKYCDIESQILQVEEKAPTESCEEQSDRAKQISTHTSLHDTATFLYNLIFNPTIESVVIASNQDVDHQENCRNHEAIETKELRPAVVDGHREIQEQAELSGVQIEDDIQSTTSSEEIARERKPNKTHAPVPVNWTDGKTRITTISTVNRLFRDWTTLSGCNNDWEADNTGSTEPTNFPGEVYIVVDLENDDDNIASFTMGNLCERFGEASTSTKRTQGSPCDPVRPKHVSGSQDYSADTELNKPSITSYPTPPMSPYVGEWCSGPQSPSSAPSLTREVVWTADTLHSHSGQKKFQHTHDELKNQDNILATAPSSIDCQGHHTRNNPEAAGKSSDGFSQKSMETEPWPGSQKFNVLYKLLMDFNEEVMHGRVVPTTGAGETASVECTASNEPESSEQVAMEQVFDRIRRTCSFVKEQAKREASRQMLEVKNKYDTDQAINKVREKLAEKELQTLERESTKQIMDLKMKYKAEKAARKTLEQELITIKANIVEPIIRFTDPTGRIFSFPYGACREWSSMESLIRHSVMYDRRLSEYALKGQYNLIGPTGDIILRQVWDAMIQPNSTVKMRLWDCVASPVTVPQQTDTTTPFHLPAKISMDNATSAIDTPMSFPALQCSRDDLRENSQSSLPITVSNASRAVQDGTPKPQGRKRGRRARQVYRSQRMEQDESLVGQEAANNERFSTMFGQTVMPPTPVSMSDASGGDR